MAIGPATSRPSPPPGLARPDRETIDSSQSSPNLVRRPPRTLPQEIPSIGAAFMSKVLKIENLRVGIDGKEILKGVDLTIREGEVHALMGPNGSGKSTLSYALAGHPNYEVLGGTATLDGRDLLALEPDERAKAG